MFRHMLMTACLLTLGTTPLLAQDRWLDGVIRGWEREDRARTERRFRTNEPTRSYVAPRQTERSEVRRPQSRWRTEEPVPGPLPVVPATLSTEHEFVVYVWLDERMAGAYRDGKLVFSMPIVPGSRSNPSNWLIGKTIILGEKTKDYWSRKRYPDRYGRMAPAWMAYANRLLVKEPDGTWFQSGFFFHKGDMSVWQSKTRGSHGCFRLTWQHAIWVFNNVPTGTPVVVQKAISTAVARS